MDMTVKELAEVMGKLDSTHTGAEEAIATFILANAKVFSSQKNKVAFVSKAIQAYAFMLQEAGVKVET